MRFWRRYWYWIGGVIFIGLAFFMGLWGSSHLPVIQTILIFGWMAMLAHQVEEYGFPGGFPSISNMAIMKEKEAPDRFIFNSMQCFIGNVVLCYAFYILSIIFPNVIWLGSSMVYGALMQLLVHGILMFVALRWVYNPGWFATVFLQTPVAIYYTWYVITTMPDVAWQCWIGIPGSVIILLVTFAAPALFMRSRTNKHPFTEEEMFGYRKDEVLKIYNNGEPSIVEKLGIHL